MADVAELEKRFNGEVRVAKLALFVCVEVFRAVVRTCGSRRRGMEYIGKSGWKKFYFRCLGLYMA